MIITLLTYQSIQSLYIFYYYYFLCIYLLAIKMAKMKWDNNNNIKVDSIDRKFRIVSKKKYGNKHFLNVLARSIIFKYIDISERGCFSSSSVSSLFPFFIHLLYSRGKTNNCVKLKLTWWNFENVHTHTHTKDICRYI